MAAPPVFHRRPRPTLPWMVVGGYLLSLLIVVGGALAYAWQSRQARFDDFEKNAQTLSRSLDEHVQRTVGALDLVLSVLAADLSEAGEVSDIGEARLHLTLRERRALLPQTNSLFVYDEALRLHAGSGFFPVPKLDGRQQPHVVAAADPSHKGLHVGRPQLSPVNKKWSIPITRRIESGGRLIGVAGAIVDPAYFENFYRDLQLPAGEALLMMRDDGPLLFRFPALAGVEPGHDMRALSPVFGLRPPLQGTAVMRLHSRIDGLERVVLFRRVAGLGLIVAVSQEVDSLLAPWRSAMWQLAAGLAVAVLALSAMLALTLQQIRRRAEDARQHSRTLESKVRARTAELQSANEELDAFNRSVSHDLRTPLNAIGGFAMLLRTQHGERLPDDANRKLALIEGSVQEMSRLTDDLLALSRAGRQTLQRTRVELGRVAQEVVEALSREQGPQAGEVVAIVGNPVAQADAGLARVVLKNLLSNALKYSARATPPRVEFGTEQIDGEKVFYVRDNGAGFDMKDAGRLFHPFVRLHSERDYPGTGIGLATVARIVQRHGGRVWGEAVPGHGATFRVALPDDAAAEAATVDWDL